MFGTTNVEWEKRKGDEYEENIEGVKLAVETKGGPGFVEEREENENANDEHVHPVGHQQHPQLGPLHHTRFLIY